MSDADREIDVGLFELIEAFRQVLEEAEEAEQVHSVETENITVKDRMVSVMEVLEHVQSIEFDAIFRTPSGIIPSRAMVVATFLAILVLGRAELPGLNTFVGGTAILAGVWISIRSRLLTPESGETIQGQGGGN